jgi:hypothetical protein
VTTSREDQIGLCQLAQLTDLDLSYNFLVGDIPTCLKQMKGYVHLSFVAWILVSLSELTFFAVFEQIKQGGKLLPGQ